MTPYKNEMKIKMENKIHIDSLKASKSLVVIKGCVIGFDGGDKYQYTNVSVKEILLNKTKYNIGETIRVAHYNWYKGIPKGKNCIIYLTPWPIGSKVLNENNDWMLIEGNGDYACECE